MADETRKPTGTSDDEFPSPPNLIREPWRQDLQDPPNLHRLTTRQTIEHDRVVELYERFAASGAHTPVQNEPAALVRTSRRRHRIRKHGSPVKK